MGGPTWGWLAFALDAGERALKPKALKSVKIPVAIVQAGEDDRVWKQTNKWAARRLSRGRYVEVTGAKHEVIMETDALRGVFLEEFDAMAAYVSPIQDLSPVMAEPETRLAPEIAPQGEQAALSIPEPETGTASEPATEAAPESAKNSSEVA